jgi:hypothetical protein
MFSDEYYKYYDILVEFGVATEDEVGLVVGINGARVDVLQDILYCRTGYNDFDLFLEEGLE